MIVSIGHFQIFTSYIVGNGWKSPNINFKTGCLGFQDEVILTKNHLFGLVGHNFCWVGPPSQEFIRRSISERSESNRDSPSFHKILSRFLVDKPHLGSKNSVEESQAFMKS